MRSCMSGNARPSVQTCSNTSSGRPPCRPKKASQKQRIIALLSDRQWHTSSELDAAFRKHYPEGGWCWDGAKARLKATLERRGGTIVSENVTGRHESRHRMVLPEDAKLQRMLERSEAEMAKRRKAVRGGVAESDCRKPGLVEGVASQLSVGARDPEAGASPAQLGPPAEPEPEQGRLFG